MIAKLKAIDFPFRRGFKSDEWHANVEKLKKYQDKDGNIDVTGIRQKDEPLYRWITGRITGRAGPEEQAELEALGVSFEGRKSKEDLAADWDKWFKRLEKHKKKHKLTKITKIENDKDLAKWVKRQRSILRKDKLSEEAKAKKARLEKLGLVFACKPGALLKGKKCTEAGKPKKKAQPKTVKKSIKKTGGKN